MARRTEATSSHTGATIGKTTEAWKERLELVRLAARTQALYRSGVRIFAAADYDALFDVVLERLWSLLKVDAGTIFLAHDPGQEPTCRVLRTSEGDAHYSPEDGLPTALASAVFHRESALEVVVPDPLLRRFVEALPEAGPLRVLLAVPAVSAGEVLGVLVVGRRQSAPFSPEHRELLRALADQTALALVKLRALEAAAQDGRRAHDLVSVTSHELRTPLTALQGFSELLLSRQVDPEVQRSWLALMNQESVRLGSLVGELLDLSRIESGRLRLNLDVVNLTDLLRELAGLWSRQDGVRRRLYVRLAPDLGSLIADAGKVRQVISDLISNAIKYSPVEAPVRLEAAGHCLAGHSTRHLGSTGMREVPCPAGVSIVVRDEGVGLAPEDRERVFQPFYRVAGTEVDGPAGAGLGLTIARRLVEWHGGRMWVESRLGKGSNFGFCLPPEPPPDALPPKDAFN